MPRRERLAVAGWAAFAEVQQTPFAASALALQAGIGRPYDARTAAMASPFAQAGSGGSMVRMLQVAALCHGYAAWIAVCEAGSRRT